MITGYPTCVLIDEDGQRLIDRDNRGNDTTMVTSRCQYVQAAPVRQHRLTTITHERKAV
jgi:hypothetical protein